MNVQLFNVSPAMPKELEFLDRLSRNIWWCWHPLAVELFVRIDPNLWREQESTPRSFLAKVSPERLKELSQDAAYLRQLRIVQTEFERSIPEKDDPKDRKTAYFSMEFGLHESVRLYSGGLGILSGDHLKAASDMKLPLVAVGLLYRQGYFRQALDHSGWQTERYPENELNTMPMSRAKDASGNDIFISIPLQDRELWAGVWVMWVGNVPLVLLDTEVSQNPADLRETTWRLYGGDKTMRLRQELLLGIGGFKALLALGYEPEVCHMNEGHAAFLSLARIEHLIERGYAPDVALEIVWRTNVFTTHTPVPAGNEVFPIDMLRPYLQPYANKLGMDVNRIIFWGVPIGDREHASEMSMTVLGLRMANYSNGVSKLHGEVARDMWKHLWPGRSVDEIPIRSITNGVHIPSWVSPRLRLIFDRYFSSKWLLNPDPALLEREMQSVPDEELWMAHDLCRQSLVRKVRFQIRKSARNITAPSIDEVRGKHILDPDILTIGFARRFATYKRGTLLLRNRDRLLALLRDSQRPVQFIFAGKAHPADNEGKGLIQQLITFAEKENVGHRLVFLEDYSINIARSLVQGVDVWLNTPKRPQEASGTSGMKAAVNGVLNCSILDGWWAEAYTPANGWAIPSRDDYLDQDEADNCESQALFNIIEREIIPSFYERIGGDIPTRWIQHMKASIVMALGTFSSVRMVDEYEKMFYSKAEKSYEELVCDKAARAVSLVNQKGRLVANFGKLYVAQPTANRNINELYAGDEFSVRTEVYLGDLTPEEISVEAYYGLVDNHNQIVHSYSTPMRNMKSLGDGRYAFECKVKCEIPGRFGLTARITPAGSDWINSVPGFMCWPR
ncbi:MAG: alpha-glucan family phosphorylase [Victivallaceae bacterium]|nr:alpha-glucan family phosphorylase [Victivallaceae bacterium]